MRHCLLAFAITALMPAIALAVDMRCPPMPAELTTVSRDVKVEIEASAGKLGKVAAGQVAVKTDTTAKAIFDKYPGLEKLIILQTLSSTYCSALNTAGISGIERAERWERFLERYLELKATIRKNPSAASAPAPRRDVSRNTEAPNRKGSASSAQVPSPDEQYRTALEFSAEGQSEQAVKILRQLAQAGHPRAQYQMGRAAILGDGVSQSYADAFRWFALAARSGIAPAQHNLAVLYQDGLGTFKDETQAQAWFTEAARAGFAPSRDLLTSQGKSW